MVGPFAGVALVMGASVAGGMLAGWLGGGKKEQTVQSPALTYAPVTTYSPVDASQRTYTYSPAISPVYYYSPAIQYASPGATITKKETVTAEATATPDVTPTQTVTSTPKVTSTPETSGGGAQQFDLGGILPILVIGVLAIGALYILKDNKK